MKNINIKDIYGNTVSIEIVSNEEEANFITHSGTFHADEVMATIILANKFGNIKLFRTNKVTREDAFVYDIGYGKFDHHSIEFNEARSNGIKYASCGLVWKAYGKDIISKLGNYDIDLLHENVDKNLIMDIDRDDNGQALLNEPEVKRQAVPNLISYFNPNWDDLSSETEYFLKAVSFASEIFNNYLSTIISKEKARNKVERKIEESENGIMILDEYMPWKDIVLTSKNAKASNILYTIFPSKRGGYNVVATPKENNSFEQRKAFPESWGGKENKELQDITGVSGITFCHKGLFLCACNSLDDAIKIANISIKNKEG